MRGDIQRKRQQLEEAETEYAAGIEIAERSLRRLTKESDRLEWTKGMGNIYRGMVGVFIDQNKPQEALQLWEWYQSRSRVETKPAGEDDTTWPEIEETVLKTPAPLPTASASRLVYAKTKDRLYIWIIGKPGVKIVLVPDERGRLEDLILAYSLKCSSKDSEMTVLDAEGKKLFSLLLEPVAGELRDSDTVVVELDPALKGLLLETLKSPEGWYFGQKYPVIYSPGFIGENALHKAARRQPESGVLLDAGGLLLNERDDIIHLFPAIRSMNGADTTAADLPQVLESSEIFVFIGHAVPGALLLNDKEKLTTESFPRRLLGRLQLAVLAACSTGSAQDGLPDTGNLAHALVAGGTPNVLASQWDVDSDATRGLMKSFFEHLKKSESVPRALLEARRQVYKSRNHPYYWAGFSVTGRAS